jgi:hypothetical protein
MQIRSTVWLDDEADGDCKAVGGLFEILGKILYGDCHIRFMGSHFCQNSLIIYHKWMQFVVYVFLPQ